jgi:hypothetical protein
MMTFKILTTRLPLKWQKDLQETLGTTVATPTPAAEATSGESKNEITVTAENLQIVDDLLRWIQRMNRQQKSTKPVLPSQGISLTIARPDGSHISLTERNVNVVKQFLSS